MLCQFAGEVVARGVGLPVPGPVLGMLLLLVGLTIRGGPGPGMVEASGGLLRHLPLLFVPAGAGVMTQFTALGQNWLVVLVAIVVPTLLGLGVTGWVMQRLIGVRRAPDA